MRPSNTDPDQGSLLMLTPAKFNFFVLQRQNPQKMAAEFYLLISAVMIYIKMINYVPVLLRRHDVTIWY